MKHTTIRGQRRKLYKEREKVRRISRLLGKSPVDLNGNEKRTYAMALRDGYIELSLGVIVKGKKL